MTIWGHAMTVILLALIADNSCWDTYSACEDRMRDAQFNQLVRSRCTLIQTGPPGTYTTFCPPGTRKAATYIEQAVHRECEDSRALCSARRLLSDGTLLSCLAGPGPRGWCMGVRDGVERCTQRAPADCYYLDQSPRDGRIDLRDFAVWMLRFQADMDDNTKWAAGNDDGRPLWLP